MAQSTSDQPKWSRDLPQKQAKLTHKKSEIFFFFLPLGSHARPEVLVCLAVAAGGAGGCCGWKNGCSWWKWKCRMVGTRSRLLPGFTLAHDRNLEVLQLADRSSQVFFFPLLSDEAVSSLSLPILTMKVECGGGL